MTIEKMPGKKEKRKALKNVLPGSVVRFPETPLEEVFTKDAPAIYMVVDDKTNPPDRITLISLDGKGCLIKRDADREVIEHDATIQIGKAI